MSGKHDLRIVWWNANDFFHFDPIRVSKGKKSRWPVSLAAYEAKHDLVKAGLAELQVKFGDIDILCLCEITNIAAERLRDQLFSGYRLISLDIKADEPTLQVAIIYPENDLDIQYYERPPLTAMAMPHGTRPMPVLDIITGKDTIRLIACHWQARLDEDTSNTYRGRTADFLGMYSFDFIDHNPEFNHVLIVGDLNEEPYERSLSLLNAHRHRGKSLKKQHWQDRKVKRVHLYNASWRHFGEKHAHPSPSGSATELVDSAGTYYWEAKGSWHNFDQIILSGGLLRSARPFIDESSIVVVSLPSFVTNGFPAKFQYDVTGSKGLSDHLPIFLKISV